MVVYYSNGDFMRLSTSMPISYLICYSLVFLFFLQLRFFSCIAIALKRSFDYFCLIFKLILWMLSSIVCAETIILFLGFIVF